MGIALYGLRDSSQGLRRRVPLFLSPYGTELLVTPQGKKRGQHRGVRVLR